MSPSTALRPREESPTLWRAFVHHDVVLIVVLSLVVLLLAPWLVRGPSRVPLTVVNDTEYELTVEASRPGNASWTPVAIIDPRQSRTRAGTIDQGDEWVFRFSGQGRSGGEIAVTHDELADNEWRFVVPPDVARELENAGATPPPR